MLCEISSSTEENEIIKAARRIHAVSDSHDWIDTITKQIDDSSDIIMHEVLKLVSTSNKWNAFVKPIVKWLTERLDL